MEAMAVQAIEQATGVYAVVLHGCSDIIMRVERQDQDTDVLVTLDLTVAERLLHDLHVAVTALKGVNKPKETWWTRLLKR